MSPVPAYEQGTPADAYCCLVVFRRENVESEKEAGNYGSSRTLTYVNTFILFIQQAPSHTH